MIVDSFAGIGGTSEGLRLAGLHVDHAINHSPVALAVHAANHPTTEHHIESVWAVDPIEGTRFFWLSPSCTHFSKAKGSVPKSNKLRGLAWLAVRWATAVRPDVIGCENVEEMLSWGPLLASGQPDPARKGKTFRAWVRKLERLGYVVEHRVLRACDYGAPTTRRRLFVVARRDGLPIVWPEPTHSQGGGLFTLPYRSARECIDWTLPIPSIFGRKRPYSLATQKRIARGLTKYGSPTLIQRGFGERVGQAPRVFDLDAPMSTIPAQGVKHAIVVAFVAKHFGGKGTPGASLDEPLSTITTRDHHALVVGRKHTSRERRAECRAWLDEHVGVGALDGVQDIGMRYLVPRELARAQGFRDDYVLAPVVDGKRLGVTAQVQGIGNSVPPALAEAIARANYAPSIQEAAE